MFHRPVSVSLLVVCCCDLVGCSSGSSSEEPPGNPVLWTQGCGTKVQPTTSAGDGRTIEVAGPRDSYQSYQVVVRGDQGVLNDVRFSWTDLTNGDSGDVIEASQIELFRQWFVDFEGTDTVRGEPTVVGSRPVPESSPTSDTRVPDPLIPLINPYEGGDLGQPFQVSTNQNQPIWVDVHIPKGISAGTYAGTITMTSSQGEDTVPISVQVWDLDLPDMGSVQTMYQFSIDPLSRYHSGTAESPDDYWLSWSERSRLIVKRYEQLAHSHRIDTKQQFVRLAAEGCEPPASWSTFDQSIQSYMDGSYWDDGVPSTILQVALSPGHTDEYTMGAGCSEEQYKALASAWADHLKEQGWFDRAIVFVLDEPSDEEYSLIIREAGWMIEADPDWKSKILATIQPRSNNTAQLNPALGIYCVNPPFYVYADSPDSGLDFSYYGRDTEYSWQQLFDEGIALWFYDSNSNTPPYPTFATNALDGLEPTMLMWGSWYEHATGSLFWTINYWDVEDPWGPSYETWRKTGDGVLLYPGHHDGLDAPLGSPPEVELDGPIPSYRLKMIRLGLQDWALFSLAERLGLQELARAEVSRAYAQLGCNWIDCDAPLGDFLWNTDESIMNDVRRNVATAVIDASP